MYAKGSRPYRQLTVLLSLAAVVVFANLHALQPLLPELSRLLVLTPLQASWSYAAGTLTLGLSLLFYSAVSDAVGRRPILLFSLAGITLSTVLLTQVESYQGLLWTRALQGLFLGGLPAVAVAYFGEELEKPAFLTAVGLYISASSLGGISGRLLAGVAAELGHWNWVFWGWSLVALLLLWACWRYLPASLHFRPKPLCWRQALADNWFHLRQGALFTTFLLGGLNFFIFLNQYTYIAFVLAAPPYALSSGWIGVLFLTYLTGTLGSAVSARLAARWSQPLAMALGVLIMMLGTLLTLLPTLWLIVLGFFVSAFGFFLTHSLASSWVNQHASRAKASASALYLVFYYLGASTGGLYLHWFWQWQQWPGIVAGSLFGYAGSLWLCARLRRYQPAG